MTLTRLYLLMKLAAFGLMAALVAGWFQEWHPVFDTPSHFRLHFAGVLVLLCGLLLLLGFWRWVLPSLAVVGMSLYLTHPYLPDLTDFGAPAAASTGAVNPGHEDELTVVQLNIRFNNRSMEHAAAIILDTEPDVVLLQEITRTNEHVLPMLEASLPHQLFCHRRGIGSVAILSRFPFTQQQNSSCLERVGFAQARIQIGDRQLSLASFHSRWPFPRSQPRQMAFLQKDFEGLSHPLILAGDFNSSPWSAAVQRAAAWTRTQVAEGVVFTWGSPFELIRNHIGATLPIDQIMISPELEFRSRSVMADVGSDHLPVVTRIRWR